MTIDVVDLSHYQPDPDWAALKAAGVQGVILKCTEGDHYVDPTFRERYDAAIAHGMPVATYHFMRPGPIGRQIDHYLNTLRPRRGERVCLDHEDRGVSLLDLETAVTLLEADRRDLEITIYSGNVIKEQLGDRHSEILSHTSLWLAQYSSVPKWPTTVWPTWTLWQYTDSEVVPGITGKVDANRFNGSRAKIAEWIGPATPNPMGTVVPPTPPVVPQDPMEKRVSISIAAPEGVMVDVFVNGTKFLIGH